MTNAASANPENYWEFDFLQPQPTQDTDLLQQLGLIPGFKELLMLRQVHALEHATVWVLSENANADSQQTSENSPPLDNENLGGLSTDQGFYLYGQVNKINLQQAVRVALQRLKTGEWNLAVHPRCGTNLSVAMVLTAGMVLGTSLLLPRDPFGQLIGVGLAATTAFQIAPDLGNLAQKYITTSIPFNLAVADISATTDIWGRAAHFVGVHWRDSQ
ncbi:MAG: hypothetical protein F6K10_03685 [Moorea sp. SIO2B7]|nr:hypothetical protein [Moorena sp. SIO2B7]